MNVDSVQSNISLTKWWDRTTEKTKSKCDILRIFFFWFSIILQCMALKMIHFGAIIMRNQAPNDRCLWLVWVFFLFFVWSIDDLMNLRSVRWSLCEQKDFYRISTKNTILLSRCSELNLFNLFIVSVGLLIMLWTVTRPHAITVRCNKQQWLQIAEKNQYVYPKKTKLSFSPVQKICHHKAKLQTFNRIKGLKWFVYEYFRIHNWIAIANSLRGYLAMLCGPRMGCGICSSA